MNSSTFTITHGRFRDVGFKVHHPHDSYKFCAYIFLAPSFFEDKEFGKSLVLTEGDKYGFKGWFGLLPESPIHGGVTAYRQHIYAPNELSIEIGWDFNHLHDGGESLDDVLRNIEQTINWLHDNYKYGFEYAEASK